MTENVSGSKLARLDELARTTAEYAAYSRAAYGAAAVVTGLAVLAALALDVAGSDLAPLAYALLPAGWLLLVAAARAYYQRRGQVVQRGQRIPGRGWMLALVWFLSAGVVFVAAGEVDWYRVDPFGIGFLVAIFAIVAVPLLAARVGRTWMDVLTAVNLLSISQFLPQLTRRLAALEEARMQRLASVPLAAMRWVFLALLAGAAVGAAVVGLRHHAHHRVLVRRIAALKGAV